MASQAANVSSWLAAKARRDFSSPNNAARPWCSYMPVLGLRKPAKYASLPNWLGIWDSVLRQTSAIASPPRFE